MATYEALRPMEGGETNRSLTCQNGTRKNVNFVYTEPFLKHYMFRHHVDHHNNARHAPISLEESISTKDWKIRVFMFVLAVVVEVNARLALSFFTQSASLSQLEFRRLLAKELMGFSLTVNSPSKRRSRRSMVPVSTQCGVETAPLYARNWTGMEWHFMSTKYPQHVCKSVGCKRRVRTFCRCMIGFWLCPTCIGIHIAQLAEAS